MARHRLVTLLLVLLALYVTILNSCGRGGPSVCVPEAKDSDDPSPPAVTASAPFEMKPAKERAFSRFAFSPDGQYVVTRASGVAELWKAKDGSHVRTIRREQEGRFFMSVHRAERLYDAVVFSPDGSVMAVARRAASGPEKSSMDYEIAIEKVADGTQLCTLPMRSNMTPPAISFSDDGRYVIGSGSRLPGRPSGCKEPPLDIWDAQTGERVWDPDRPVPYPLPEFEQRRETLLREVGNGKLSKASAEADLKLLLLLRDVRADGKPLVVRGTIHTHGLSHFSPDGRWLVTRDGILPGSGYSSEAVIWNARDCRLVREFDEDDTWVEPFLFDVDANRFLRRAHERPRQIYDTATGKPTGVFAGLPTRVILALAPGGKKAVVGVIEEAVLFDTESGRLIKSFAVQGSEPRQAEFSPDGTRLVVEFGDRSVDRLTAEFRDCAVVYETREPYGEVFRLEPPLLAQRYRWYAAAYNANGRRILYGGALWDGDTGRKIRQFGIVYD